MEFDPVPDEGPLLAGRVYQRKELNRRFGGNPVSGIVVSPKESVILLFHTTEKAHQFYHDGYSVHEGIYLYSGEGAYDDMEWTHGNRSIRDHDKDGRDIYFFERAQRKDGLWRLFGLVKYVGHRIESRPDRAGAMRGAIIFALLPLSSDVEGPLNVLKDGEEREGLDSLRKKALARVAIAPGRHLTPRAVFERSATVRRYALARSAGICEACGSSAPFHTRDGRPFLEVHHIDRLADEGLDDIRVVGAICPNCHRRCHYSLEAVAFNNELRQKISLKEPPGREET